MGPQEMIRDKMTKGNTEGTREGQMRTNRKNRCSSERRRKSNKNKKRDRKIE